MFQPVEEATDKCIKWNLKEALKEIQSRLLNCIKESLLAQHGKTFTIFFHNFPLTNLNVNVFKALGSSTIFCKLAATVKYKHGEKVLKIIPSNTEYSHQRFNRLG